MKSAGVHTFVRIPRFQTGDMAPELTTSPLLVSHPHDWLVLQPCSHDIYYDTVVVIFREVNELRRDPQPEVRLRPCRYRPLDGRATQPVGLSEEASSWRISISRGHPGSFIEATY